MAENKKSFLIYCDILHSINHLTIEEKGILFQHLLEYVNDMNPILTDRLLLTAWKPIERQLKRDLVKYEKTREKNRENALLRWNKKNASASERIKKMPSDANHADNDNDNDNDNVKDRDINALDFLESKIKTQIDVFYSQNKNNVHEWQNMLDSFNDKMDIELAQNKISFNVKELLPRLKQYCRSWISNQKQGPHQTKVNDFIINKDGSKILKGII